VTLSCLSTVAGGFDPDRREVALTTLNVLLGLGTALSPLIVAFFLDFAEWWYLPLLTGAGLLALLLVASTQRLVVAGVGAQPRGPPHIPPARWVFAVGRGA